MIARPISIIKNSICARNTLHSFTHQKEREKKVITGISLGSLPARTFRPHSLRAWSLVQSASVRILAMQSSCTLSTRIANWPLFPRTPSLVSFIVFVEKHCRVYCQYRIVLLIEVVLWAKGIWSLEPICIWSVLLGKQVFVYYQSRLRFIINVIWYKCR